MIDLQKLKSVVQVLSESAGIGDYEVYYVKNASGDVSVLDGVVSSVTRGFGAGLSYRCRINGRLGYACTESLEKEDLQKMIESARQNALLCEDESVSAFAGPLDVPCPNTSDAEGTAVLKQTALDLFDLVRTDAALTSGSETGAGSYTTEKAIFNSNGLFVRTASSCNYVVAQTVLNENGESQSSYSTKIGLDATSQKAACEEALEKTHAKFGGSVPPTGKYDVVMSGRVFRAYLGTFMSAFSGKNAMLGLSVLAGKENTAIASDVVTLVDDIRRDDLREPVLFDDEGTPSKTKNLIENGVLKTFLYDRETACRAGKEPTGNGARTGYEDPVSIRPMHCRLQVGTLSLDRLFQKMQNGIYITEAKGFHAGADACSGDFSIESAGFLVENGQKTKRLKSFTVSGNFFEILKKIIDVGNEADAGLPTDDHTFSSPDVLIGDVSIAGE